ncbi:MetQ/NlpA family ABC transporter substrate-binding protein [Microbacterium halotolerans]|uniref:MetQ/NlpA family ABC transporter substrate-binding protein n=1 Tax=Microbacterium halotolerans TaxID=246613 RepID=UPI000E6AC1D0|nr:MetQ/NlpA family ABC transporter substrate-binding protein [Microbacterium halotolerans]
MRIPARILATAAIVGIALSATACGASSDDNAPSDDKTNISVGFNPGPYREYFEGGIVPLLEDDGFTTESMDFTDGITTNAALGQGEVDAIIMQHEIYQSSINEQEGLSNRILVLVPTAPMGLFGGAASSLDDAAEGSTVAVPSEPANMYRALNVLEKVGWVELSDSIDAATASPADITKNVAGIELVPMENAQQVSSLSDVDFSAIQGNFIISGGLDLTDALALEDLGEEFTVGVSVDEKNLDTPWAQALKDAFTSPEFAEYIAGDPQYDGYTIPAELQAAAE